MVQSNNLHIAFMSLLGAFGLILNILYFLAGINAKQSVFSSIEFLRRFKTVVAILGLSIYIPIDLFTYFWTEENWPILCSFKGMLQRVFLDSQWMVVLSLAVVRLRLSCCKQITILLVDNSPTYITLCVLLLLPITNAITTFVSFLPTDEDVHLSQRNYSRKVVSNRSDIYMTCQQHGTLESKVMPYVALSFIPLLITCGIYLAIFFRISKFPVYADGMFNDVRQFNRRRFRKQIKMAFLTLLAMLLLFWFPYTVLEILVMVSNGYINIHVLRILLYLKIVIFLLHPFSDAGFDRFRKNLLSMKIAYLHENPFPQLRDKKEDVKGHCLSPEDISKGNEHNPLSHTQLTMPTGNNCIRDFNDIMIMDDELEIGDQRLRMKNSRALSHLY